MGWHRMPILLQPVTEDCALAETSVPTAIDKAECLEQILRAFLDIADRDDIHQAAERLERVRQWIDAEQQRASADPIFSHVRLV